MRSGIFKAHGSHCTLCQSSDKSDKSDLSDILCSHPVHCAMRSGIFKAHGSHGVVEAGLLAGSGTQPCAPEFLKYMALTHLVPPVRISPYQSVSVRIT